LPETNNSRREAVIRLNLIRTLAILITVSAFPPPSTHTWQNNKFYASRFASHFIGTVDNCCGTVLIRWFQMSTSLADMLLELGHGVTKRWV